MNVFVFVIIIVMLVTAGKVASEWLEGRKSLPAPQTSGDGEVEKLREQVALLAGEVDRLSEEQRFMTRLLEGGARRGAPSGTTSGTTPLD